MLHFKLFRHRMGHTICALCLLIIVFTFVTTACGASADNSTAGGAQTPTVPQTPTAVVGYGTSQGCPNNAIVTTSTKATITVLDSSKDSTIKAHPGDVIEFRLAFGKKWGGPTASQGVLDLQGPAGYAMKANKACIWVFKAMSTGTTELTFTNQPLCKRGQICPMYIAVLPFTVQVK